MAEEEVHRADGKPMKGSGEKSGLEPRQITAIVLGALIVLFALSNLSESTISIFWISDVRMPRIFVIVICGLIGFGIGWFIRGRADKADKDRD